MGRKYKERKKQKIITFNTFWCALRCTQDRYLKNSVHSLFLAFTVTGTALCIEPVVFAVRNDTVSQKCSWNTGAEGGQTPIKNSAISFPWSTEFLNFESSLMTRKHFLHRLWDCGEYSFVFRTAVCVWLWGNERLPSASCCQKLFFA